VPSESSDPILVRSIAVTSGDVVAALELNRTSDDEATLRVTPPFSARMRARLHVDRTGGAGRVDRSGDTNRVDSSGDTSRHQPTSQAKAERTTSPGKSGQQSGSHDEETADSPTRNRDGSGGHHGQEPLYVDPEQLVADVPEYPRPTDTRAELLADAETPYTVERHHEYHAKAIEEWRESVPACIRDRSTIETPGGPTEVTVRTLGGDLL
jgi:hypothetical protein